MKYKLTKTDLLINTQLIGVQKGGTSSVYNWIAQHPDIYAPVEAKDYHYFHLASQENQMEFPFSKYYKKRASEKIMLKGAVNYIFFDQAAENIYDYNPDTKLLLILRNPKHRAISAYNYFYKLGQEKRTWEKAIDDELNGNLKTDYITQGNFSYLKHGLYSAQIKNYLKYFDLNQIKILIYEEIMANKEEGLKDIFSFLGVENTFEPVLNHINKTGNPKHLWFNRALNGESYLRTLLKPFLKALTSKDFRIKFGNWLREVNTSHSRETKPKHFAFPDSVISSYRNDIQVLNTLLNRDLTKLWNL